MKQCRNKQNLSDWEIEIIPQDREDYIAALLDGLGCTYSMNKVNIMEDNPYDIEIIVANPYGGEEMVINLGDMGCITPFYGMWHSHYGGNEYEYKKVYSDISAIISGEKMVYTIRSIDRWFKSGIENAKLDNEGIKSIAQRWLKERPNDIQAEEENEVWLDLVYWGISKNKSIEFREFYL